MPTTVDEAIRLGVEAHKAGNLEDADRYYTSILNAQPRHPDANHNMGVLAIGIGKAEAAISYFKTALEENRSNEIYWASYVNAHLKLGKVAEARTLLQEARETGLKGEVLDQIQAQLDAPSAEDERIKSERLLQEKINQLLGLFKLKNYAEVVETAETLSRENPTVFVLYNLLGACHVELKNYDQAVPYLEEAARLNPDSHEPYYNLGMACLELGQFEKSVEAFKKTIGVKKDLPEAYFYLGVSQQKLGSNHAREEAKKNY